AFGKSCPELMLTSQLDDARLSGQTESPTTSVVPPAAPGVGQPAVRRAAHAASARGGCRSVAAAAEPARPPGLLARPARLPWSARIVSLSARIASLNAAAARPTRSARFRGPPVHPGLAHFPSECRPTGE